MSEKIWYTRCPIPTASGIAFQRNMFDEMFQGTTCQVHNIAELPQEKAETHFDHSLESSFREGGLAPPLWARSIGADTALVGITYIEESLILFVREDSDIRSIKDLKGKRLALPRVPDQRIDFLRFAAQKAFVSSLRLAGLTPDDATWVDIIETRGKYARINRDLSQPRPQSSYHCVFEAVVNGEADAAFGKSGESAYGVRMASGPLRPIINLMHDGDWESKINNATPRLLTVSGNLLRDNPDAAIRYVQTLVRAAKWAEQNHDEAVRVMALEASITEDDIRTHYDPQIHARLVPTMSEGDMEATEIAKNFMFRHGFLPNDFALKDWARPDILQEAYARENLRWAA